MAVGKDVGTAVGKDVGTAVGNALGSGKISADMAISDIVEMYPDTIEVFFRYGMHCIGCAAARFETLAEGCAVHGIDAKELVDELNSCISFKD